MVTPDITPDTAWAWVKPKNVQAADSGAHGTDSRRRLMLIQSATCLYSLAELYHDLVMSFLTKVSGMEML